MQRVSPAPQQIGFGTAQPGTSLPNPVLVFSFRFVSPLVSAIGSPNIQYVQPVSSAEVPGAALWLLVIMFIIEIVALLSDKNKIRKPVITGGRNSDGTISMSLVELTNCLEKLKQGVVELPKPDPRIAVQNAVARPGVTLTTPANMTLAIIISATVSGNEGDTILAYSVPLLEFVGITGGLPIIIMSLIATILARAVVPPSASGISNTEAPKTEPLFQLKTRELMEMIKTFTTHYRN